MLALRLKDTPERIHIEQVPVPEPAPGQALVKIAAAALNRRDHWCRLGKYPGIAYNVTLGSDGCGTVEQVNGAEHQHWVGRQVVINPNIDWGPDPAAQHGTYHILGMPSNGTLAEYVCVPVHRLHAAPAHLSAAQAAALPLGGLTAYRALFNKGQFAAGQKVLISGIGGGVAQMASLFAKAAGGQVSVTSGSEQKITLAIEQGATAGFNYKEEKWFKKALKEQGPFDLVIDSAGGKGFNDFIRLLKPGGKIVFYGATAGMPENLDVFRMFWNQIALVGSTMGNDAEFAQMLDFISQHQLVPPLDTVRPFNEVIAAFDSMAAGSQNGKIVLQFGV